MRHYPRIAHNWAMRFGPLLGWGVVIYATAYLAWSVVSLYQITGLPARVSVLAVLIATTLIAGKSLRLYTARDVLPYSFGWVLIVALFDIAFAIPSSAWGMYADPNLWFGYALVVSIPLLTPYLRVMPELPHIT